jgi:hypothetical protein
MSELTKPNSCNNPRNHLLATACIAAILPALAAHASELDSDHPTVWVELGGQLERLEGTDGRFTAPFMLNNPAAATFQPVSPLEAQRAPRFSYGAEGKMLFEPSGSDWVFSAGIRYGRSNGNKKTHQQTYAPGKSKYVQYTVGTVVHRVGGVNPYPFHEFTTVESRHDESHVVVDFQAGRDVGLGLFAQGESHVNLGVRMAQFVARTTTQIKARPELHVSNIYPPSHGYVPGYTFNVYSLTASSNRSFQGIGPSLSWDASVPFAGNRDNGYLTVDWGIDAALLFGRQKAKVRHQTSAMYGFAGFGYGSSTLYHPPAQFRTSARSVTVPNVGGFAGVSMKFPNAKVSMGYRADFFFGAMDTGIDTHRSENVSFHGPFATISIGLGG